MRTTSIIIVFGFLLQTGIVGNGGREGNRQYEQGNYVAAERAYRNALERENLSRRSLSRLNNNLGSAVYRQGRFEEALERFEEAANAASSRADMTRAAYNAGNAAYRTDDLQRALSNYRQALLADPSNESARYNYEFVKRRLDESPETHPEEQGSERIQPSEFARNLKARADLLVARRQYAEAHRLLEEGLQVDPTVAAFSQYISRLADVVEIEEL